MLSASTEQMFVDNIIPSCGGEMTRQELIERIKRHEQQCGVSDIGVSVYVHEAMEPADGILVVLDTNTIGVRSLIVSFSNHITFISH
jgi:hypothetical protein